MHIMKCWGFETKNSYFSVWLKVWGDQNKLKDYKKTVYGLQAKCRATRNETLATRVRFLWKFIWSLRLHEALLKAAVNFLRAYA